MSNDFDDDLEDGEAPGVGWGSEDRYTERAAGEVLALIQANPEQVYYERQLQVRFEEEFYHWVVSRAVDQLVDLRQVQSATLPLGSSKVRFFFGRKLRYWRRKANEVLGLVSEYSDPEFTRALGRQAEMLFDAALPKEGFISVAENVREYQGRSWKETDHNLDRIIERDGVAYGVEIKNTLRYIDGNEFATKLQLCKHLRLKPLFIVRMMPKSYIHRVNEDGGFGLIFGYQLYPFGAEKLARRVREKLGLPVDCPAAIQRGTVKRFANWHVRNAAGR